MGFNNPLTGLNGSLIYPQIKSPNFDMATETGWAILKNGDAYFFNVVATGTITATGFVGNDFEITSNGVFFYSGTPAVGNLVMSWAESAGSDSFGNSFPQGLSINEYGEGENAVILGYTSGSPLLYFVDQVPNVKTGAGILGTPTGAGTAEQDGVTFIGPADTTYNDFTALQQYASSRDDTENAKIQMVYTSQGGVEQFLLVGSAGGVSIPAGSITAVKPGTGTVGTPAVGEGWHNAVVSSALWVAGTQPVRYRLMPDGTVMLDGSVTTTGAGPWPAAGTIFMLPSGYQPAESHPFVTRSAIAVAANTDTVNVLSTGNVQNGQTFTAAGQTLFFEGVRFSVT